MVPAKADPIKREAFKKTLEPLLEEANDKEENIVGHFMDNVRFI